MPWNLPFQLEEGSQTSKRISESEEGFIDPAMRQKAGRLASGFAPGGVNSPAGRASAMVIVLFGSASEARLSQVAALPGETIRMEKTMAKLVDFMCWSFVQNGIAVDRWPVAFCDTIKTQL